MKSFIDSKLIKYAWYRKWQAKRSRKLLTKRAGRANDDTVESYTPSDIIKSEKARYDALLQKRVEDQQRYEQEQIEYDKCLEAAKTEALSNPSRTEEIYQENVNNIRRLPFTKETAMFYHCKEIADRLFDERYSQKS